MSQRNSGTTALLVGRIMIGCATNIWMENLLIDIMKSRCVINCLQWQRSQEIVCMFLNACLIGSQLPFPPQHYLVLILQSQIHNQWALSCIWLVKIYPITTCVLICNVMNYYVFLWNKILTLSLASGRPYSWVVFTKASATRVLYLSFPSSTCIFIIMS